MSLSEPVIDWIDGDNRIIYLVPLSSWPIGKIVNGACVFNPVDDIYVEVRRLRNTDEELRKYDLFCDALPLINKGGGSFTGRGLRLLLGTRIHFADVSNSYLIDGELLSDEGFSGVDLISETGISAGVKIRISYAPPPSTEVVVVNTEGGGTGSLSDVDIQRIIAASAGCPQMTGLIDEKETISYQIPEQMRAVQLENEDFLLTSVVSDCIVAVQYEKPLEVVRICQS